MNVVVLIGTLMEQPTLKEFDSGYKGAFITLKVPKPFRSMDGSYEFDYIKCVLWEGIAQSTCEYCMKGDMIGIRGRVATYAEEVTFNCVNEEHKKKVTNNQIIVERVSFISTSKKQDKTNQNQALSEYENEI